MAKHWDLAALGSALRHEHDAALGAALPAAWLCLSDDTQRLRWFTNRVLASLAAT